MSRGVLLPAKTKPSACAPLCQGAGGAWVGIGSDSMGSGARFGRVLAKRRAGTSRTAINGLRMTSILVYIVKRDSCTQTKINVTRTRR